VVGIGAIGAFESFAHASGDRFSTVLIT